MVRNVREGVRDQQRSKVYEAEHVLKDMSKPLPEVADVERYVTRLWKMRRVQTEFDKARFVHKPKVKDGRGTRIAHANSTAYYKTKSGKVNVGHINIPTWARSEWVVVHELAHIIANKHYGKERVAAHGWQFCATFLKLVLYAMGREAHDALKASFKKHRVRFREPRKGKPLSPERRAAMIEALANARVKKIKDGTITEGPRLLAAMFPPIF